MTSFVSGGRFKKKLKYVGVGEAHRRAALKLIYDALREVGLKSSDSKHNLLYDNRIIISYEKCRQIYFNSEASEAYLQYAEKKGKQLTVESRGNKMSQRESIDPRLSDSLDAGMNLQS